jgi:hypothetical protein
MMTTKQLSIERVCYVSRKWLREVLEILDAGVGHPNMNELWQKLFNASTVSEVDEIMLSAVGSSGLIEFLRFNHGGIVHKGDSKSAPGNVRVVVGNPSIMRRMVEHVPDACQRRSRTDAKRAV